MITATQTLNLWPWQHEAWFAEEPLVATIAPVGDGKSYWASRKVALRAFQFPDSIHLCTANTIPQVKTNVVPAIKAALEQFEIGFEQQLTDHEFRLACHGGKTGTIRCRATDSDKAVDRIRGPEYGTWWRDEGRDASAYATSVLLGRLRCTKVDRQEFYDTTTPAGFGHIYKFWLRRQGADEPGSPSRRCIHVRKRTNPLLPAGYDALIRGSSDEALASQELEAAFVALGQGRAYTRYDRVLSRSTKEYDPERSLILCCDFNRTPHVWVIAQTHPGKHGNEAHFIREQVQRDYDILDMANAFCDEWKNHTHGVEVYGDASGGQQRVEAKRSCWAVLREVLPHFLPGVRFDVPRANPSILSRVNTFNAMLKNAAGNRRCFVNQERCPELDADLSEVRWAKSGDLDKRDDERTHASDGAGYFLHRWEGLDILRIRETHFMNRMAR